MTKKLILDVDTGIDDTLAIAYALGLPEVDLIGITTLFGNTTSQLATENTLAVLALLGREDIPVYEGAHCPWGTDSYEVVDQYRKIHGVTGLGNLELASAKRAKESRPAVDFLLQSARQYGDDLILVTTGPLTNLAEAIQKDREAMEAVGRIVSMAGALTIPGNVSPFAEANVYNDPQAAKYVFESGVPIVAVGLDVTLKTMITGTDIQHWAQVKSEASQALVELATYYYQHEYEDVIGGAMHDPLAVAVAVHPEIVTNLLPINLTVETRGESTGRLIGNLDLLNARDKSGVVCLDIEADIFVTQFTETVYEVLEKGNK